MAGTFDLGDIAPLSVTIRDASGTLANGGTVTVTVTQPDGSVLGPTVVAPTSTGVYDYDFAPSMYGGHKVRWLSTGANSAAFTDVFSVEEPSPVSLADLKRYLNITSTVHDEELRGKLDAAVEMVEHEVGPLRLRTTTETVGYFGLLSRTPVASVTAATYGGFSYLATLTLDTAGLVRGVPAGTVVTYVYGRAAPTSAQREAVLVTASHLWETQRGVAPTALQADDGGGLTPGFSFALPRRALELLAPTRNSLGVVA